MCMRMASNSSTTSAADRSVLRLRGREEGTRVSAPARVTAAGAPRPGSSSPMGRVRRGTREEMRGRYLLREVLFRFVDEWMFLSPDHEHTARDPIPPGLELWALAVIET